MTQDLVNIVVGVAGTAMGWMLKVVWDSIRVLQDEMKTLERTVHTQYVTSNHEAIICRDLAHAIRLAFSSTSHRGCT